MENVEKFDISVILPIKTNLVNDFEDYFTKSIESLKIQKTSINELVIVACDTQPLIDYLNGFDFGDINVKILPWEGKPSYTEQINYGVNNATSKWVSLFEFDDEYSTIWFKNVKKYSESYSEVDAFLPIVVDTNDNGLFVGFTNEATFAANFASEIGILTNETLLNYQNFQSSGMVIKKEVFIKYGLFKPSFRLTYVWEMFLRLTYNSVKIMSIPKIGYKHLNLRRGSIFWNYKEGEEVLTPDEVKFWIDSAKKEHFFIKERDIKYEPENV
jgi:hypothetical protein